MSYGWAKKGELPYKEVPMKIQNTTLVCAISTSEVVGYQVFNKGVKAQDFLGFMSNLTHSLKS